MATSILLRSLRHWIVPSASSFNHKWVAGNAIPSSSLPMGHKWGSFAQTFSSKPAANNSIDLGTTNTSSSPMDGKAVTNPKRLQKRPLRQFTMGSAKSAGRNSSGRITIFHRGGGSKRLQRTIDEKRSTSSIGVVERVEYDPNRSSRIALVRWIEGVHPPRQRKQNTIEEFDKPSRKILEPNTTTVHGRFSFSSLPGKVDQRREASSFPGHMASYAMVGLSSKMLPQLRNPLTIKDMGNKKTCCKDIFFSAFSSSKSKGETTSLPFSESFDLPRMAVAGAKPAFFTPRVRRESMPSLCEVRKMRTNHQMKRKAAVSWQSFRKQETLRLIGSNPKPKTDLKLPGKSSAESISLGQPVPTSSPATSSVESISLGQPVSASSPPLV